VIYKGPFREVLDDDGHWLVRGQRAAVCDKTYQIYKRDPYADYFEFVDPLVPIALEDAGELDCLRAIPRHPKETKGLEYDVTTEVVGAACGPSGCC
jgi:arsenite methyltransferase